MIRRPPRSTLSSSSAASDVYKRQVVSTQSTGVPDVPMVTSPRSSVTDLTRTTSGRIVEGLQRQLSDDWLRLLDQPLECPVCLEHINPDDQFVFSACQHSFCRECASGYLDHSLQERESFPVVCPGFGCSSEVNLIDWEIAGCSAAQLDSLERWGLEQALMRTDGTEQWRACRGVDCRNGVFWSPEIAPRWLCESCSEVMCLACRSSWHEGLSCAQHKEQAATAGEEDSEGLDGLVRSGAVRACPHCGVPTYRAEGCNHISCKTCSGTWYWGASNPEPGAGLYVARASKWSERARSALLLSCSAGLIMNYGSKLFYPGSWWPQPFPVTAVSQAIQMVAESTVRGMGVFTWPMLTTHGFVIPIMWTCLSAGIWTSDGLLWLLNSYLIPSWLPTEWLFQWTRPGYELGKSVISLSCAACIFVFGIAEASMVLPVKLKKLFSSDDEDKKRRRGQSE
eukprot:TRINITY_DN3094_c0_g1_i2.p1 TRINITY_DN3094_c0_g1~~TRINITY_DN3094_c0_g1_i2.p1  ORF type:complete len:453 (+),score=62.81 TRINITY_DN3094_c0_g1_i2:104-1462(+)